MEGNMNIYVKKLSSLYTV